MKTAFCENGGFPEVSVACRFLDNLRGFRVRPENHEIQRIYVLFTKIAFGENRGFPEVSAACRFLFNLRGFRVRRENHGIQQILRDSHKIPHHSWPFAQ